jgi:hypothetical protein
MILTKNTPFTKEEIAQLATEYQDYIKTVIDVENKTCSAGGKMHADCEKNLLEKGSLQSDLWGGGIDLAAKIIDFTSLINIRPRDENPSMEILKPELREEFEVLMKHFFHAIF